MPSKHQEFERSFHKLNSEQREAVEAIEGPVMVVAGPGTGKTQVLAMRIAQILIKTQSRPNNILALTFTEAGVTALRQRLVSIIGPDAYQVGINTFHGFANEVITTFPYVFYLVGENNQLGELERLQIIDQIVNRLTSLNYLRPSRQVDFHVPAIASAIKTLKQEAVLPERLIELIKEEGAGLSQIKGKTQRQLAEKRQAVNLELAQIYNLYQKRLATDRLYDYEDMILMVIEALKSDLDVKGYYQERYQYLLVDEYQDTNNAQNTLVETLVDFFDRPNLFVVGDDKQAIYRFQGASVANMLHFTGKFPQITVINLTKNYRNPPALLRAASELIEQNHHQLVNYLPKLRTKLVAQSSAKAKPVLIESDNEEAQLIWLSQKLKKLIDQGTPAEEIAVLWRTNAEVSNFRLAAEKLGLPIAGVFSANLVLEPEIQRLLTLLRSIRPSVDDRSLLLSLSIIDSQIGLVELSQALKVERKGLSLIAALSQAKANLPAKVNHAIARLIKWQQQASHLSLTALLEQIYLDSDFIKSIDQLPNKVERLTIIRAFFDEVSRLTWRQPTAGLDELLNYFDLSNRYRINFNVNRAVPAKSGIFVATVHGAKGLEFDYVFMSNASDRYWRLRSNRSVIRLPSSLVMNRAWQDEPLEDERRLFYVGLTRARKQLYLSFSRLNTDGRAALPCQFVAEIQATLTEQKNELEPEVVARSLSRSLQNISSEQVSSRELTYIREQITSRPFTFTDWQAYKQCPRRYLLINLLGLPSPANFGQIYGIAIHKALELFFRQYRSQQKLPSLEALNKYFQTALSKAGLVPDREVMLAKGQKLLTDYYQQRSADWSLPVGVEYSFYSHRVLLDDIWLSGKFDRLDSLDPLARTVRIIDYKTGSRAKSLAEIEGTTQNSQGDLKQQLIFYALLAQLDRSFPFHAQEFRLDFIDDAGKFNYHDFRITPDEIELLKKDIKTTYQSILTDQEFAHTSESYENGCQLCELLSF